MRSNHHEESLRLAGLALMGVVILAMFVNDTLLPLQVGVALLAALTVWGVIGLKSSRRSVLPRLYVVAFSLPFAALLPNIISVNHNWWHTPRALAYISDRRLMEQLVAVATIGLLGLLFGLRAGLRSASGPAVVGGSLPAVTDDASLDVNEIEPGEALESGPPRTLSALPFVGLLLVAFGLSWLSAPQVDIFSTPYAAVGNQGRAESLNLNAAYLVSYLILILLAIDAEREMVSPSRRRLKYNAVLAATVVIVLLLQLLHGDRESIGLVVGLMALYVTAPHRRDVSLAAALQWNRVRRLAVPAVIVVALFLAIGSARSTASKGPALSPIATIQDGLGQNTWTAILLTNLGVAAEYRYGPIEYLNGATYMEYVLSLPPGGVTRLLGIDRPIEPTKGPGWWTKDVASGGAHAVIVPFKNFGAFGVLVILAVYGYLIARVERLNRAGSLWGRLLFGTFATCSLLWFWYGDLVMVRGIIAAVILGLAYNAISRARVADDQAMAPAQ